MAKTITLPKDWQTVKLRDISIPITEKAGDRELETLSISAGVGFVNQAKKFGKELSGKQYVNYSVLRFGDFSFNKGNSRKYPYGCTYMLRNREIAAVPNAFYSFRINDQFGDYYEQLFMLGYLNKQLKRLINTGVRDDGLFNLYEDDFYNCEIPIPPFAEQRRIAEILTTQDYLIALKQRLIDAKKQQKRWLMQNLLTGKVRLPGFIGEWTSAKLNDIGSFQSGKFIESQMISEAGNSYPCYGGNGVRGYVEDYNYNGDYVLVGRQGNLCGNVKKVSGRFYATEHALVLTRNENIDYLWSFYLLDSMNLNRYATKTAQPGLSLKKIDYLAIKLPSSSEQTAIAERLTTADREIELLTQELEQQKLIKKYLMQQLLTGRKRVSV